MQNTIKVEEFVWEIKTALEDIFVANIRICEGKIEMRFLNSQHFIVSIDEV
jgi:hypothetical protein